MSLLSYTRVENHGEYVQITDVDSLGRYYSRNIYQDGIITNERHDTLAKMGWKSLSEFLKAKKGFTLTGC